MKDLAIQAAKKAIKNLGKVSEITMNDKLWDSLAGALIVKEVEGKVTDVHGRVWSPWVRVG